jgi:hypothetical protein
MCCVHVVCRLSSNITAAGRSRQLQLKDNTVVLMEASNEYGEADQVCSKIPADFLQVPAGCVGFPASS